MKNNFFIVDKNFDFIITLRKFLYENNNDGSVLFFFGKVRSCNLKKKVICINYDVYDFLSLKSINVILNDIFIKYNNVIKIVVYHKIGVVKSGDVGILIMVKSFQREESFITCKYLIEEIKRKSSIWKKEYYSDGTASWLKGHPLI